MHSILPRFGCIGSEEAGGRLPGLDLIELPGGDPLRHEAE
jgi:hypothetical protein